jgi:elongation factor P--(R)-beta-lysine ligase
MSQEHNIKKIDILKKRAKMLFLTREFFSKKNILEVDCNSLTKKPSLDAHIDVMQTNINDREVGYLHTSPEYAMKRLLSIGIGDIYQLSHVYRKGEISDLHNPEFTMVEWYQYNISFDDFIDVTIEYINLFLSSKKTKKYTYREIIQKHANIDYVNSSFDDLFSFLKENKIDIEVPQNQLDKDDLLALIMSYIVEPKMEKDTIYVVYNYPSTQAALSKLDTVDGIEIAKRFEVYYNHLELANGYYELSEDKEQRTRFLQANKKRSEMKKETYPIDEKFLNALKAGIGDCCGVAVGFDRLLMLKYNKKTISEVLPFSWGEA